MKKQFRLFIFLLALAIGISTVEAQEKKTVLEINSILNNTNCNLDLGDRNCTIEKNENNIATRIVSFSGRGCQFTSVQALAIGNYTLALSTFGYEESRINFEVTDGNKNKIIINAIHLKEKTTSLGEVTVYGNKKQFLKVESDKTTVNVKNNAMLNSGNSFDALKRLPGVIISPSRNLTLNGKDVKVYIDGAPSTLSGTDLENYLSSLPANTIEKVELIYNPGAAFDANSNGSVINIVTSSKHQKGVNASFNINYNFNKYQNPSPQILLNGKTKNLSWQTMFGYNHIKNEELVSNSQTFTSFSPVKTLFQDNFKINTYRNVYFRLGTNYKLGTKSNLLFNYNNTFADDRLVYLATTKGDGINFTDNEITKNKHSNHEISLQYNTKLDSLGKTLSVTAFVNTFNRNPINEAKPSINETNTSNIDFGLTNAYLKYDFAFPLKKMSFSINAGGKYNIIKVKDYGKYNNSNIANTIDFNYTENNLAFYTEARKKINKLNFNAGLRFEDFTSERLTSTTASKVKYHNTKLFPNASALYEINSQMNISAS
jgi:iron complex outermembrane recepter protein